METPNGLDPKYAVGSLVRAITLLNIIGEAPSKDGVTLTEVAKELGMSKSSVFSTLQTLIAFDLVSDHGEGAMRRYKLGLGLIRLGHRAAGQTSIADVARPVLETLSQASGLTSRVAILDNGAAIALAQVDAPSAVKVNLGLGVRESVHRTALGKALLMDHSDEEISSIALAGGMPAVTSHTITTPAGFVEAIHTARAEGFTTDDEEDAAGILCVAAPVRADGRIVAAVSVTGIKAGPEYRDRVAVIAQVKDAALRLGALLAVAH